MKPNNLGNILVEACQRISISKFLENHGNKLKESLLASEIELAGLKLELTTSRTGFGGSRIWFKCPVCKRRVGVVFSHPISGQVGCRLCLNLEYRSRRYKGMLESNGVV